MMNPPPINTYPALFWGYLVVWSLLVLYTLWLGIRVSSLEKRSEELKGHTESSPKSES
ncbi:CcmD family protein [bacterium]|nr:CcmD family protein [bacterium]